MRPIARWHGGKWRIAPWILSHLPPHKIYLEPYCGAASVLLRKSRSKVEILNDAYGRITSAFAVIREQPEELGRLLRYTPCSEREYLDCREEAEDPLEDARRLIVLGHQSHGSTGACTGGKRSGWRRGLREDRTSSADEWKDVWLQVEAWADRLRGVFIEQGEARSAIARWDSPETAIYADPPYLGEIRSKSSGKNAYGPYEMSTEDHILLAKVLKEAKGAVLLSGYASPLYEELYRGWVRVDRKAYADRACPKVECLWMNEKAASRGIGSLADAMEGIGE